MLTGHATALLFGLYLAGSSGFGYESPSPGISGELRQQLGEHLVLVGRGEVERSVKAYVGDGWTWYASAGLEAAAGPVLFGAGYGGGETVTSQYRKPFGAPRVALGWRGASSRTWLRYSFPDSTRNESRSLAVVWECWRTDRRARITATGGLGEFLQDGKRKGGMFGSVGYSWAVWR